MSHKILTFSPLHQNGATAFGMMLSQALTYSNMRSLFTFTQVDSLAPKYIGVNELKDPSRSVMQLYKLASLGKLKNSEILEYAVSYTKNAYIMDMSNKTLTEKNQCSLVRHILSNVPTEVIVCDDSTDGTSNTSQALLDMADQVFLVITPSEKNFRQLKEWLELPYIRSRDDVYIVINYYDEAISSVRNIARGLGLKASHVCKMHYNPYITKCAMEGSLHTIIPYMNAMDPRVTNLSGDFKELVSCVHNEVMMKQKKDRRR